MTAVCFTKKGTRTSGLLLAILLVGSPLTPLATAYTPDDPAVKGMIERGAAHITTNWHRQTHPDAAVGADALLALALIKSGISVDNPNVQKGITTARAGSERSSYASLYSPCLACILLCEVDPQGSRKEIEQYIQFILRTQSQNGAWSYTTGGSSGDVSQTQYCVLALWSAHNRKFDVPSPRLVQATSWLGRVQDQSGGWGYQPEGSEHEPTHSMAAGGLGSMYILADLLGYKGQGAATKEVTNAATSDLPPDVRLVRQDEDEADESGVSKQAPAALSNCFARGNRWLDDFLASKADITQRPWPMYYLYGLERCQAFREKYEGRSDAAPAWYNDGVDFLKSAQAADGHWKGSHETGITTAFALLFLTRSTKKAIAIFETKGQLVAVGPIRDTGELRMQGDRVVSVPVTKSVAELLDAIANSPQDEVKAVTSAPATVINFTGDANLRAQHTAKLRALMANEDWWKRRLAVKLLSRQRDLDNIPVLIYALSDPDREVVNIALEGLRFISRKIQGVEKLPDPPKQDLVDGQETSAGRAARLKWVELAQAKWNEWYRSIRPDAEFFDQ